MLCIVSYNTYWGSLLSVCRAHWCQRLIAAASEWSKMLAPFPPKSVRGTTTHTHTHVYMYLCTAFYHTRTHKYARTEFTRTRSRAHYNHTCSCTKMFSSPRHKTTHLLLRYQGFCLVYIHNRLYSFWTNRYRWFCGEDTNRREQTAAGRIRAIWPHHTDLPRWCLTRAYFRYALSIHITRFFSYARTPPLYIRMHFCFMNASPHLCCIYCLHTPSLLIRTTPGMHTQCFYTRAFFIYARTHMHKPLTSAVYARKHEPPLAECA